MSADVFFIEGCGRCPLGNTPQCKVNTWQAELAYLRTVVLDCGMKEELKWGVPCYTYNDQNVVMIGAFNDNYVLSFLKGSLLADPNGILTKPGENTQVGRVVRFTNLQQVIDLESALKAYLYEAIEVEKSGLKPVYKSNAELVFPEELLQALEQDPAFKKAFFALTPGRQRGYNLHFSEPKQSKTRESRIEKSMPRIMAGKGMQD
jgi:uncharacterized protein YdeI (YjbR/CyaY-like superfamily)